MQVTVHNRGPEEASLHVLPTIWFRHTWSWAGGDEVPSLNTEPATAPSTIVAEHPRMGRRWFHAENPRQVLVTGNETNNERTFGSPNQMPFLKDGIDRAVVHGDLAAVNPDGQGTKAAYHHEVTVPAGGDVTLRFRLTDSEPAAPRRGGAAVSPFGDFDEVMASRRERDGSVLAGCASRIGELARSEWCCRQALSGMLWSKQYYMLDIERWLVDHGADPLDADPRLRNHEWRHMVAEDIISMPDKWEYPWFAAWDLAFHTVALAVVDARFAKDQLQLLLSRRYLHPNGQLPAYEWNFSDVNPPVHAWATLLVYQLEKARTGERRHGVPRERLPEADEELHLVAEPQGCRRPEHLPGRLPRPRQHRGIRPERPPAHRGEDRPGRRHRLDGALLAEHAPDRGRARRGPTGSTSSRR